MASGDEGDLGARSASDGAVGDRPHRGRRGRAMVRRGVRQLGPERGRRSTRGQVRRDGGGHKRAELFARAMRGDRGRRELLERITPSGTRTRCARSACCRCRRASDARRDAARALRGAAGVHPREPAVRLAAPGQRGPRAHRHGEPRSHRRLSRPAALQWAMEARGDGRPRRRARSRRAGDVTVALSHRRRRQAGRSRYARRQAAQGPAGGPRRTRRSRSCARATRSSRRQAVAHADVAGAGDVPRRRASPARSSASCRASDPAPVARAPRVRRRRHRGLSGRRGRALRDHAGKEHAGGKTRAAALAHPHDLLARGDWPDWQRDCFRAERGAAVQAGVPRAVPADTAELTDGSARAATPATRCSPRQALALLGGRGWVARPRRASAAPSTSDGSPLRVGSSRRSTPRPISRA